MLEAKLVGQRMRDGTSEWFAAEAVRFDFEERVRDAVLEIPRIRPIHRNLPHLAPVGIVRCVAALVDLGGGVELARQTAHTKARLVVRVHNVKVPCALLKQMQTPRLVPVANHADFLALQRADDKCHIEFGRDAVSAAHVHALGDPAED